VADKSEDEFAYQDLGLQEFRMAIVPHAGGWQPLVPARAAAELATPPITLLESFHPGPLPRRLSLAGLEAPGVLVTALKRAEDGDGVIVRFAESTGQAGHGAFRLGDRRFELDVQPWSVRTFRIPDDASLEPTEVDLLERSL
jgi:alpha-mannosidase